MSKDKKAAYRLGFGSRTGAEVSFVDDLESAIQNSEYSAYEKMMAFPLFVPRQQMAQFLFKTDLFRQALHVHGSIVECGVAYGTGLMTFAQCSAIMEPVNHNRRIIGFDTFSGFPKVAEIDKKGGHEHTHEGGMRVDSYAELERAIALYDRNRPVGHLPRVEMVKGDATKTIPQYVEDNPHLVVALLYMDFDLYEASKVALQTFLPRMPKGAIIAFDEVNHPKWPGETQALLEVVGLRNIALRRVPWDTTRCYAVLD